MFLAVPNILDNFCIIFMGCRQKLSFEQVGFEFCLRLASYLLKKLQRCGFMYGLPLCLVVLWSQETESIKRM